MHCVYHKATVYNTFWWKKGHLKEFHCSVIFFLTLGSITRWSIGTDSSTPDRNPPVPHSEFQMQGEGKSWAEQKSCRLHYAIPWIPFFYLSPACPPTARFQEHQIQTAKEGFLSLKPIAASRKSYSCLVPATSLLLSSLLPISYIHLGLFPLFISLTAGCPGLAEWYPLPASLFPLRIVKLLLQWRMRAMHSPLGSKPSEKGEWGDK